MKRLTGKLSEASLACVTLADKSAAIPEKVIIRRHREQGVLHNYFIKILRMYKIIVSWNYMRNQWAKSSSSLSFLGNKGGGAQNKSVSRIWRCVLAIWPRDTLKYIWILRLKSKIKPIFAYFDQKSSVSGTK